MAIVSIGWWTKSTLGRWMAPNLGIINPIGSIGPKVIFTWMVDIYGKLVPKRIMGSQNWCFGDPRNLLYRVKPLYRRVPWFLLKGNTPYTYGSICTMNLEHLESFAWYYLTSWTAVWFVWGFYPGTPGTTNFTCMEMVKHPFFLSNDLVHHPIDS